MASLRHANASANYYVVAGRPLGANAVRTRRVFVLRMRNVTSFPTAIRYRYLVRSVRADTCPRYPGGRGWRTVEPQPMRSQSEPATASAIGRSRVLQSGNRWRWATTRDQSPRSGSAAVYTNTAFSSAFSSANDTFSSAYASLRL